jgi:glutamate-5-semialdehyde dehydrogenase
LDFPSTMSLNGTSPSHAEQALAKNAKTASLILGALSLSQRNSALATIHSFLVAEKDAILAANKLDMAAANEAVKRGELQGSMVKRLDLSLSGKYEAMCQGVLDIINLPDPLGRETYATRMDTGLELRRVSCALGVLLVIFEARPEVVVNITALALKSGTLSSRSMLIVNQVMPQS